MAKYLIKIIVNYLEIAYVLARHFRVGRIFVPCSGPNKFNLNSCNILILLFLFSSCQAPTKGLKKELVKGGDFWITTYQKIENKSEPYVFYIEGDGLTYTPEGNKVYSNPTPIRQTLINLAAMDKRPNVVYVARPCQYTPMELNPKCNPSYWTDKRLSDDSVAAINDVINKINTNHQKFSLVGYSGGGGIAVLVAARNSMVKDIITIAGNLDHRAFTSHHGVTPLANSLNPIDYAKLIKHIPQLHISGAKDKVIPPFIAQKYVAESASLCVRGSVMQNIDHRSGWAEVWDGVIAKPLKCSMDF